ncbi:DUF6069 family protein [Millisia brevis]|uniref:DUF6069 family protein n=1 Tax=Millisia brevis TaxID=264148 RepID=UPI0008328C44|nr:DUF6069 family protein [Millisia brevis]
MTETGTSTLGLRRILVTTGAAVVAAVVANLVLWLIGLALGGSFEVSDGAGGTETVAPGGVLVMTILPLTVGLLVAGLMAPKVPAVIRPAQIIGSIAALGTIAMTVTAGFDTVSTVLLSLMHVVLVPVLVYALERMR